MPNITQQLAYIHTSYL